MNPVIPNLIPYTPQRISVIRENRIENLARGLEVKIRKTVAKTPRKTRTVIQSAKVQTAMAGLDEATKALMIEALKGL